MTAALRLALAMGWRGSRRGLVTIARLLGAVAADLMAERDRWFLWWVVLFGAGIAFYFSLPTEPAIWPVAGILATAAALNLAWTRGLAAVVVGGGVVAFALGLAVAKARTEVAGSPVLTRPLNRAEVSGYIELVEARPKRGQRLTIRVREIARIPARDKPFRVRVRIPAGAPIKAGDAVRLVATLAPPALPALPGDYDFARVAWFLGIGGVGFGTQKPVIETDAPPPPLDLQFWAAVEMVRQHITQRIRASLAGETGEIAAALISGERGGITDATNDAYRASGLFHILSISGLHMVIVAGAAFWSLRLALALIPGLALRWPIRKIAAIAAAAAALGYLLISGGAPATARSWLMITIGFLAILADRPAVALRTVALSALLILLFYPETLFDIGFQMSYAAVVALISAYDEIRRRTTPGAEHGFLMGGVMFFAGIVLSTIVAGLAVAPFSAYYFHNSQQLAVLANLIAIPLSNIVVMPAALAAMVALPFGLEALPLWIMGWGIDLTTWTAYQVAAIPGAMIPVPAIPPLSFQLMLCGGIWICLWQRRWRLGGLVAVAAGLALAPFQPKPDLLIGHDAHLVAVRGADGQLAAPSVKGSAFEFKRWREYDGAPVARAAADAGSVFRCDEAGCISAVAGRTIAIPKSAAALVDDCRMADIVVLSWPKPPFCRPRLAAFDLWAVRDRGTHKIRFTGDDMQVVTVQGLRGARPWTGTGPARSAATQAALRRARVGAFASPGPLAELLPGGALPPRPEVEEDDAPAGE